MQDMPKRYSIEGLLGSGVQPFNDLDGEAITALAEGLKGERSLAVPIVITSDGLLIDGHQRLRAMRTEGRKFIDANDVRIVADATSENALEWAVRLNVQRRHLSVEEKAEVARALQRERGWSQHKIAKLFGVSQPAVHQWLNPRSKPEAPEPPKVRKPRAIAKAGSLVEQETARIAMEITNPALHQWVTGHADPEDRERLSIQWAAIATAATSIAEALAEPAVDGTEEPF